MTSLRWPGVRFAWSARPDPHTGPAPHAERAAGRSAHHRSGVRARSAPVVEMVAELLGSSIAVRFAAGEGRTALEMGPVERQALRSRASGAGPQEPGPKSRAPRVCPSSVRGGRPPGTQRPDSRQRSGAGRGCPIRPGPSRDRAPARSHHLPTYVSSRLPGAATGRPGTADGRKGRRTEKARAPPDEARPDASWPGASPRTPWARPARGAASAAAAGRPGSPAVPSAAAGCRASAPAGARSAAAPAAGTPGAWAAGRERRAAREAPRAGPEDDFRCHRPTAL
ncbi:hypothetical protein CFP59_07814 [Streptomyces malaysiensis subsp. malaysiensis]|nr:hypothetical protein CFP59_07814 [Streptomyces sp. M56]